MLSTENITQNWYFGEDRSMLIPNCLFRVGGAGIVLSNRCPDPGLVCERCMLPVRALLMHLLCSLWQMSYLQCWTDA